MADLEIRNLTRSFPSGGGVFDISLTVSSGEFVVLLGPSGCGKTTLLRLIAGLEYPDSGEIQIGGRERRTRRESIAMVFQNFALYPHMTVFQNIAFPLKLRHVARDETERRVKESAAKAGLTVDLETLSARAFRRRTATRRARASAGARAANHLDGRGAREPRRAIAIVAAARAQRRFSAARAALSCM